MTEKRFTLKGLIEGVPNICDNSEIIEQEDAVDLLNALHEENEHLKNKLEFFYELNKPYGNIIEENKRLKSFIKQLSNDCGEIVLMNGTIYNVKKALCDLE